MARRFYRMVPGLPKPFIVDYDTFLADRKRVASAGLLELRVDGRYALGGGRFARNLFAALFERCVACLGEREEPYGFAGRGDGNAALHSPHDHGVQRLSQHAPGRGMDRCDGFSGGRILSRLVCALLQRRG